MAARMTPIHPGEHLKEDFMRPLDLSANRLAKSLGVPANRISGLVAGTRNITPDTALRLAKFFSTSAEFWMNLQSNYELQTAYDEAHSKNSRLHRDLSAIKPRQDRVA